MCGSCLQKHIPLQDFSYFTGFLNQAGKENPHRRYVFIKIESVVSDHPLELNVMPIVLKRIKKLISSN